MGLENIDSEGPSTARRYVQPTKEDFETCLAGVEPDFEVQEYSAAKEYVYESRDLMPDERAIVLRIYSTIDKRTDRARGKGKDAIRTVIWHSSLSRPMGGRVKTLRIESWCKNLKKKIRSIMDEFDDYSKQCPKCGGWMVIREGKYGEFLGCSNYPDCKNTENVEDVLPR